MRKEVIDFLKNLPASPAEQFNKASELYRKSENANPGIVRYNNMMGFSEERLRNLMYDLQTANNITAADLATAVAPKPKKGLANASGAPTFSKGAKGNSERRAFCAEHGIEAASNKNADLDEAIEAYLKSKSVAEMEVETEESEEAPEAEKK